MTLGTHPLGLELLRLKENSKLQDVKVLAEILELIWIRLDEAGIADESDPNQTVYDGAD